MTLNFKFDIITFNLNYSANNEQTTIIFIVVYSFLHPNLAWYTGTAAKFSSFISISISIFSAGVGLRILDFLGLVSM